MIYINRLNDIDQNYQNDILNIIQVGFDRNDDMLANMDNPIVVYMIEENQVIAVGFGDTSESKMMKQLKQKIMYIHTISVDNNYRGLGLSTKLIKKLVLEFKSGYALYLHVRTSEDDPNIPAIKSYERCGFVVINPVFTEREDGPNNVMVLASQIKPNIFNKSKKSRKKSKKK